MSTSSAEPSGATDPNPARARYDVAIVGGGIVGLATAFWCARAGRSVLVLERRAEPASLTSARSGGGLRAQWMMPQNIAMMREAIALYRDFGAVSGLRGCDIGFEAGGYLYATTTEAGAEGLARRAAEQRAAGLDDLETFEGAALRARFPHLAPGARFGLFRQGDGWLDVERLVAAYRAAAPFDLRTGIAVTALLRRAGRVVGVAAGGAEFEADAVVLAPGPHARALVRDLAGPDLPLTLVRGQLALVRLTGGMPAGLPATIDVDSGAFWRPDGQGGRITAPLGEPVAAAEVEEGSEADPGYVARAMESAARLAPFWAEMASRIDHATTRAVAGQYCVSPDGGPVIGPAPGLPGLWLHLAYGGHGIMGSIEGARRLARLVTGEARHDPADPFAPERLADPFRLQADPMTLNALTRRGLSGALRRTA